MATNFEPVFVRLRSILQRHIGNLTVAENVPGRYYLEADSARFNKRICVAGVVTGKTYVSFHLIPVYMFPQLLDGISKELRARMQGKSCFNFKAINEPLFEELERLTVNGFEACKKIDAVPK